MKTEKIKKTPAQLSAIRRAAALKGIEARRKNSKNKDGKPKSIQIRAIDYARITNYAEQIDNTVIDTVSIIVDKAIPPKP